MASNTTLNFGLQARDWETLIGIISNSADPEIQDLQFQLSTYYRSLVTKPNNTDIISIATTEAVVIRLFQFLYGNTVYNVYKDVGTNPLNRILTAIRAANNAADNYINSQLAIYDANYNTSLTNIRKAGRRTIMMLQYDNA